jgi:hydrogenase expression/formation protein HypD
MKNKQASQKIIKKISEKALQIGRPLCFMELCGTHSQSVARHGIKNILPSNIKLLSGPGCPVCVTDQEDVDTLVGLALQGIPIAAYGDALNVPGSVMSLEGARQKGAKVFAVYDVSEGLKLQEKYPSLIFWGLGFETTTPMTAWAIKNNLIVYSSHKAFPPAMTALLSNTRVKIDGFINPGHVSAIIGIKIYERFKVPQVIAGFGALNVLRAINGLLGQVIKGEKRVENEYREVVKNDGNAKARKLIAEVFEITDAKWRGLGTIKKSGFKIRKEYQKFDAKVIYKRQITKIRKNIKVRSTGCQCGSVLQGLLDPKKCPLFKKVCNPDHPQGACMVSVEGACNVEYRYGK